MPSVNRPVRGSPRCRAKSIRSRDAVSTSSPRRANSRPTSVSITSPGRRSTSATPRFRSRSRICIDSAGWVMEQASAARPKWPCLASAERYRSCLSVIIGDQLNLSGTQDNSTGPDVRYLPRWLQPATDQTGQPNTCLRKITERSERNMDAKTDDGAGKCPFTGGSRGHSNRDWWPEHLDIGVLHTAHPSADPMGKAFDYAKEFKSLDLNAVIEDLRALMTDSQAWWP